MKLFYLILIFLITSCSFDDKTGIWKNQQRDIIKESKNPINEFEKISNTIEAFNQTIVFDGKTKILKKAPQTINEWKDIYFSRGNNLINFSFSNLNETRLKSKKISKNKISKYILAENEKLIMSDSRGNIIIFSISENLVTNKFNFYKKKYKKIEKKLNFIVDKEIIYISDNLGYLYAYNYKSQKVIWAKNYKIPFRSNLKLFNNKLIASNQNNDLIFFEKISGNIIKLVPSEETLIKKSFVNNLSLDQEKLFFLNSFGTLYSLDLDEMTVLWFTNLNQTLNSSPSNIFDGTQIINKDDKIIASSQVHTYIIDSNNGSIISKKNFSSKIKPIIYSNLGFFISNDDFLICIDLKNNKKLYSYNLNQLISNNFDFKKKKSVFKSFLIANNHILIFLENSYYLKLSLEGDLLDIEKLPSSISSSPIVIDNSLVFINKKNQLLFID